ncbi:hypothetical protein LLH00_05900 [bacterium]|nr:hypothetical protein [bacterium]
MNQELANTLVPITTTIPYGLKKRLENLAREKANGQDNEMAPYIREGIDWVCRKYGVTDEQIAVAS